MEETTKTCTQCGETKSRELFTKRALSRDGLCAQCKACRRRHYEANTEYLKAKRKAYYAANRDRLLAQLRVNQRRDHLRSRYGISVGQWEALFDAQDRVCAICKAESPGNNRRWHTDHCHAVGTVRGILCHNCNVALGHFQDLPERLLAAHAYLTR